MFGKDMHPDERCEKGDVEQIRRIDVHWRVQRLMHGKAYYVYGCCCNVLKQTGKYSIFFVIHNKQIHLRFFGGWLCDFFLSADGGDSSVCRVLCKQPSSPAFSQREKERRQEQSIYSEALALWERVG